ncbi:Coagulation factor VIII [Gossypium arboreum]|uniref:Coagulation factor VIII n=1 Tax=Gossypium arboreum TaxID=29729 RepID=A0A0B0P6F1_GOSAR|nr:Coagulation factor VIII [Gossypium arboreum]
MSESGVVRNRGGGRRLPPRRHRQQGGVGRNKGRCFQGLRRRTERITSERNNNNNPTNLDRFLEFTTPVVPAQRLPQTIITRRRRRRRHSRENPRYFVLKDLWESMEEWSVYGAGVHILLEGYPVIQYYVPYLSAIQLYIDPSRPSTSQRMPGEESSIMSSSSSGSNDAIQGAQSHVEIGDAEILALNRLSLRDRHETDTRNNPAGQLVFEYFEQDEPSSRKPLTNTVSDLASQFPALTTYRSCDLLPSSWISVAWYPIYRVPMGPTLKNLDACFLTYHCLSTPSNGTATDSLPLRGFNIRELDAAEMPSKLPLPTFGLAFYKFQASIWNAPEVIESPKANSLLQEADNWLRHLQVDHPDFRFFVTHT